VDLPNGSHIRDGVESKNLGTAEPARSAQVIRTSRTPYVDQPAAYARDLAEIPGLLSGWFRNHGRVFPWRQTTDPYHVLIAVFMLQRTGVSQVMNVYERFVTHYPDLEAVTEADDQELADILRPLGRVDRWSVLKNLARTIIEEYGGGVPEGLEELDALPGIGQYSARAVMCLAFGRPHVMLDPNSYRVLSRACGITADKARPHTDWEFIRMLDEVVPEEAPQTFNLALLDVGSKICRKKIPRHEQCPLRGICLHLHAEG